MKMHVNSYIYIYMKYFNTSHDFTQFGCSQFRKTQHFTDPASIRNFVISVKYQYSKL